MSTHGLTVLLLIKEDHPHHDDVWSVCEDGSVDVQWRGQTQQPTYDKCINKRNDILVFVKKRGNEFYTCFGRVSTIEMTESRIVGQPPEAKGPLFKLTIRDFKNNDTGHLAVPKADRRQYRFQQACYVYLWGPDAPSCSRRRGWGVHVWPTTRLPPILDDVV